MSQDSTIRGHQPPAANGSDHGADDGQYSIHLARRIASEWHTGQRSALYAFCSSGAVMPDLFSEVENDIDDERDRDYVRSALTAAKTAYVYNVETGAVVFDVDTRDVLVDGGDRWALAYDESEGFDPLMFLVSYGYEDLSDIDETLLAHTRFVDRFDASDVPPRDYGADVDAWEDLTSSEDMSSYIQWSADGRPCDMESLHLQLLRIDGSLIVRYDDPTARQPSTYEMDEVHSAYRPLTVNGIGAVAECFIDSHLGQYAICSLVDIAEFYGLTVSDEDRFALDPTHWESSLEYDDETILDSEAPIWAADAIEQTLNDATIGGYWQWVDGDFFLIAYGSDDDDRDGPSTRVEDLPTSDEAESGDDAPTHDELVAFIRGYEECVEFTDPDGDYTDDQAAEGRAECAAFLASELVDLRAAVAQDRPMDHLGHDFWLTRNHHGVGFWDRGLGDLGDRLTNAVHVYGEVYIEPIDDDDIED